MWMIDLLQVFAVVGLYAFIGAWTAGWADAEGMSAGEAAAVGLFWPLAWSVELIGAALKMPFRLGTKAHRALESDDEVDVDLEDDLARRIEEACEGEDLTE